jgi:hypothetical protein
LVAIGYSNRWGHIAMTSSISMTTGIDVKTNLILSSNTKAIAEEKLQTTVSSSPSLLTDDEEELEMLRGYRDQLSAQLAAMTDPTRLPSSVDRLTNHLSNISDRHVYHNNGVRSRDTPLNRNAIIDPFHYMDSNASSETWAVANPSDPGTGMVILYFLMAALGCAAACMGIMFIALIAVFAKSKVSDVPLPHPAPPTHLFLLPSP